MSKPAKKEAAPPKPPLPKPPPKRVEPRFAMDGADVPDRRKGEAKK